MRGPKVLSAVLLGFVFGLLLGIVPSPPLLAQGGGSEVGIMVEVVERVTGIPSGGAPVPLAVADAVLLDMTVETARASYAGMTLGENGSLQMGPETRLLIDRATVNRATGASDSLLSVLLGKIRLALSGAFRGSLEVETPTATIGIKGTTLALAVDSVGDTVVWVVEGEVAVTSKAGGTLQLKAGFYSTVSRGAPPTGPTPFDPESGVTAVRVLPPVLVDPQEDAIDDPLVSPENLDLPPRRDEPDSGDGVGAVPVTAEPPPPPPQPPR